jgi:hypothetical protein
MTLSPVYLLHLRDALRETSESLRRERCRAIFASALYDAIDNAALDAGKAAREVEHAIGILERAAKEGAAS